MLALWRDQPPAHMLRLYPIYTLYKLTFPLQLHWLPEYVSVFRVCDRPVNPVFFMNIAAFFALGFAS